MNSSPLNETGVASLIRNRITAADFAADFSGHLQRLQETGFAELIETENGADLVLLPVATYRELIALLDRIETVSDVSAALEEAERGEGDDLSVVASRIRAKYSLPA